MIMAACISSHSLHARFAWRRRYNTWSQMTFKADFTACAIKDQSNHLDDGKELKWPKVVSAQLVYNGVPGRSVRSSIREIGTLVSIDNKQFEHTYFPNDKQDVVIDGSGFIHLGSKTHTGMFAIKLYGERSVKGQVCNPRIIQQRAVCLEAGTPKAKAAAKGKDEPVQCVTPSTEQIIATADLSNCLGKLTADLEYDGTAANTVRPMPGDYPLLPAAA